MSRSVYGGNGQPAFDTYAIASEPAQPHNKLSYAVLDEGAAFYYWGSGLGGIDNKATIGSATFSIFTTGSWGAGPVEVTLYRADGPWSGHGLTWNHRPGTTGAGIAVSHSPSGPGVEYAFDVTDWVQDAVTAGRFNGFVAKITTTGAGPYRIFAREATSDSTPLMVVDWTAPGGTPSKLQPQGIVGTALPVITGLPVGTQSVRVKIDATSSGFGSPDFDSGTVDVTSPQLRLDATGYTGGPVNTDQWYIVSTKAAGGDWSDYSDPVAFRYVPLPTVVFTAPSDAYPTVSDPSPTFVWQVTFPGVPPGDSQTAWRVYVTVPDSGGRENAIYDTGKLLGGDGSAKMPAGVVKDRRQYRVWVQVWDTYDRVDNAGALSYARASQLFTFVDTPGVAPVTDLQLNQLEQSPEVAVLWWRDEGSPDSWTIWRDDVILLSDIDPADVDWVPTGGWRYVDIPSGFTSHEYYVQAVQNGNSSLSVPRQVITTRVTKFWLLDPARQLRVLIFDTDGLQVSATDQATVLQPVGSRFPSRFIMATGALVGSMSGTLATYNNVSAFDYYRDLRTIKNSPETPVWIAYQDTVFLALIGDVAAAPHPTDPSKKHVTFNFWQIAPETIDVIVPPGGDVPPFPVPDVLYDYESRGDGTALTVGMESVTAIAGTPTYHTAAAIHGVRGWNGGSLTRPIINPNAFTLSTYARVTVNVLSASASLFQLKNNAKPGGTIADIRLRTKGTIDLKIPEADDPLDNAAMFWLPGVVLRADLRGTCDALGQVVLDVWLYAGPSDYEDIIPTSHMHAEFTSDYLPTLVGYGKPSGEIDFDTQREWFAATMPGPYGPPLPVPALAPGVVLRTGGTTQTTIEIGVYTGGTPTIPVSDTDVVGLRRSTSPAMTGSVVVGTAGPHDDGGFNRFTATGLTAGTDYYFQITVNGTLVGAVHASTTLRPVGVACITRLAVGGCNKRGPSSPASWADIDAFAPDRIVHLGDDGYPDDLNNLVTTHQKWYAKSMTDLALVPCQLKYPFHKKISDHDCNAGPQWPNGNGVNFNDEVTATSLVAWAASVPARMVDTRSPQRARYYSEVEGNVRYVYTDERSLDRSDVRENYVRPDADDTTMLGAIQLAWLVGEFTAAAAAHQLVVCLFDTAFNGVSPYLPDSVNKGISATFSDKWASYQTERTYIRQQASAILGDNFLAVSSDTHACQLDDGASDEDGTGFASIVCGPYDQQIHAHYQDSYQTTYPSNVKGDAATGGDPAGSTAERMQYVQMTLDNVTFPGKVRVTAQIRECTPGRVADGFTGSNEAVLVRDYTL